jgi:cytochrome c nitrite reductase small subunit
LKKLIKYFLPPEQWRLVAIIVLGLAAGFGSYVFYISRAYSYLSDKPETCINCHIMAPQYATWAHSSHHLGTTCNDCHVPHNNVVNKYYFKAKDGMRHATIFTLRSEPQVIFIKEAGRECVQNNCLRCHEKLLGTINDKSLHPQQASFVQKRYCWECHRETPHGRVNSLSAVPFAKVPLPQSPVPDWLKRIVK